MLCMILAAVWVVLCVAVGLLLGKMMRNAGAVILLLAMVTPVYAQDVQSHIDWTAYNVLVAGNAADLVTTQRALLSGTAHERNPLLGSSMPRIIATKVAVVGAVMLGMRQLETHGHPTAARWLGLFGGGVGFAVAAHNASLAR